MEVDAGAQRPRGTSFETVYQEYLDGESGKHRSYSRPTAESRERWEEVQWYAWFIHEALDKLWMQNGGPLCDKGLKQAAAAQRLWYLMRRWSADNAIMHPPDAIEKVQTADDEGNLQEGHNQRSERLKK
jgi:hypothetical protein